VHHVTINAIPAGLTISLDLEVDGGMPFGAAHEVADGLETAIRKEIPDVVEVETHIEPLQSAGAGRDAAAADLAAITRALAELAAATGALRDVHDVRLRDTDHGQIVNFHCDVDPARTVGDVHELVDELERALRRRFPAVKRVIGHAEPRT
jgi:divalent metal cation (Fe/Co/Zn/Cd) transporter